MFEYQVEAGRPERLGVTKEGKDINFAVTVRDGGACSLLLYPRGEKEPEAELEFSEDMQYGDLYAMKIRQFPMDRYEYNYRINGTVVQDPYADAVAGREVWGDCPDSPHEVRCRADFAPFPWQGDQPLELPYEKCVLYMTHPRGFTMDPSSRVRHPGTFAGIKEKIPYLKNLGITQLELMPVYEFAEAEAEETPKKHMPVKKRKMEMLNYWGYGKACFFAPKASYSASGNPVREMKELVRELHKNGIELILEFYFPYMTSPALVRDCVKHWVSEYHIDGVHVNAQDTPLICLSWEPLLSRTKIMSEYFPLERIYESDYQPTFRRLAEYNDDFMIKARRFLKGDEDTLWQISESMRRNPAQQAVINYIACHNGFTLADAVSYDVKHNEDNGEDNRDGTDCNHSCNYGEEGPTSKKALQSLRRRQMRNAFLILLLSQGVPAVYGGDEMGNSQRGNNNAYCQDNEISWIQWSRKKYDRQMQDFVREAIAFRGRHAAFGRRKPYVMSDYLSKGMPDLSYHGTRAWYGEFESYNRQMGILYAGEYTGDRTLYVLYNMHMIEHEIALPTLPAGQSWYLLADTGREGASTFLKEEEKILLEDQKMAAVPPRTIWILTGETHEND
mgnify:FL=1